MARAPNCHNISSDVIGARVQVRVKRVFPISDFSEPETDAKSETDATKRPRPAFLRFFYTQLWLSIFQLLFALKSEVKANNDI